MQLSSDQQHERFDLICGKTSLAHDDLLEHGIVCGYLWREMARSLWALCGTAYILDVWILLLFVLEKPESFCIFKVVGKNSLENTTDCPFNRVECRLPQLHESNAYTCVYVCDVCRVYSVCSQLRMHKNKTFQSVKCGMHWIIEKFNSFAMIYLNNALKSLGTTTLSLAQP